MQQEYIDNLVLPGEDELEISEDGFGAWSHSKLKMLRNCPLQFFLKYVLKAKGDPDTDTSAADIGSSAHLILEHVAAGKDIDVAYNLAWEKFNEKLSEQQWDEFVRSLELNITSFKERLEKLDEKYGVKRIVPEMKVGITKDLKATTFFSKQVFFRGIVDLSIELMNGDALILDHKTGGGGFGIRMYREQLETYKIMQHFGINPIKGAQAGIHFIRAGEIAMDDYTPAEKIEDQLVKNLFFYIDSAIQALEDYGYFKHIAGNACKYCEYATACKSGKLKALEKSTSKYFKIKPVS